MSNATTLYLNGSATAHDNVLDMLGNKIINLQSAPTLDTDAANKKYVDDKIYNVTGLSSSDMTTLASLKALVESYNVTDEAQIQEEISTARAAELLLRTDLSGEIVRAVAAELVLRTDLATEVSNARAAELVLRTDLSGEIVRAKQAELDLSNNLASEAVTARAAELVLRTDLSGEIVRAKAAEVYLTTDLSGEIVRAKAAEDKIVSDANAALETAKVNIQAKTDLLKEAAVRLYKQLYNIDISAYTLPSELPTFTYTPQ